MFTTDYMYLRVLLLIADTTMQYSWVKIFILFCVLWTEQFPQYITCWLFVITNEKTTFQSPYMDWGEPFLVSAISVAGTRVQLYRYQCLLPSWHCRNSWSAGFLLRWESSLPGFPYRMSYRQAYKFMDGRVKWGGK